MRRRRNVGSAKQDSFVLLIPVLEINMIFISKVLISKALNRNYLNNYSTFDIHMYRNGAQDG